ncbi:MAG: hypothetical protein LKE33_01420 [Acidaminococcus sp.]|jgi:hypothetical protein|nr:hypothetical protein [Acidaminococcus sp.]MCI2099656.1 hypothetical protein [Acidaminococcus sp.]MCI2113939.1 hypothetical protein [Acidaminococcus sp.]MCI2115824.1 hypothetical protein [Acidaminococcus sp.]
MQLTHVCEWNQQLKKWQRISIEDAASKYPYGVSAKNHLFICELCHQSVTLTKGSEYRIPYFRHTRNKDDQSCPEKSFNNQSASNELLNPPSLLLPLKIKFEGRKFSHFEIGIPAHLTDFVETSLTIKSDSDSYVYKKERLFEEGITYLDVGHFISDKYLIGIPKENMEAKSKFDVVITGIDGKGTLFSKKDGKKIPVDGNVLINQTYYLLVQDKGIHSSCDIKWSQIESITQEHHIWNIYTVEATYYSEKAARFFSNYGFQLSDSLSEMIPLWPCVPLFPYGFYYTHPYQYFYLSGDYLSFSAYPNGNSTSIESMTISKSESLVKLNKLTLSQIVVTGRYRVLRYLYPQYLYSQKTLKDTIAEEEIAFIVKDEAGKEIKEGIYQSVPSHLKLKFTCRVDGFMEVLDFHGNILFKMSLKSSDSDVFIDVGKYLQFNREIQIFEGLDCVWKIKFARTNENHQEIDDWLYDKLRATSSSYIDVNYIVMRLLHKYRNMPKTHKWILKQIRTGKISKKAFDILKVQKYSG